MEHDVDEHASGIVHGLFKKRVRMELGADVDAIAPAREMSVRADVTVNFAPNGHGKLEPRRIIVSRVLPAAHSNGRDSRGFAELLLALISSVTTPMLAV